MKILIIGAKGMLGKDLSQVFAGDHPTCWDRDEIDIGNQKDVQEKISTLNPNLIINAAAYNAVDACEDDPAEHEKAMLINGIAVQYLSEAANQVGARLIHYSTDYVFDGKKSSGYRETDEPSPISVYGKSKLKGEQNVQEFADQFYLIRLSRLFGLPAQSAAGKKSFVDMMIELSKTKPALQIVDEEFSSPTFSWDLAEQTKKIIDAKQPSGIYHSANQGACTWAEFAKEIFRQLNIPTKIEPVPSCHFPRPAKRPAFSRLLNSKLPEMRSWQSALKDYLKQTSWAKIPQSGSAKS